MVDDGMSMSKYFTIIIYRNYNITFLVILYESHLLIEVLGYVHFETLYFVVEKHVVLELIYYKHPRVHN